jgi:hypothetical protein
MKRDMNLIKALLEWTESNCDGNMGWTLEEGDIEGYDMETIKYHINLCINAGLLTQFGTLGMGDQRPPAIRDLTWSGHDMLASIRANG